MFVLYLGMKIMRVIMIDMFAGTSYLRLVLENEDKN